MRFGSIRTRLTVTIALLTALLLVPAVAFGTNLVEGAVIDNAVDDRLADYEELIEFAQAIVMEGQFDDFGSGVEIVEGIDGPFITEWDREGIIAELESVSDEDLPFLFEELSFVPEAELLLLDRRLGAIHSAGYDGLVDLIPNDDGVVSVIDSSGFVVDMALRGGTTGFDYRTLLPEGAPVVVPASDLMDATVALTGVEDGNGQLDIDPDVELVFRSRSTDSGQSVGLLLDVTDVVGAVEVLRDVLWFAAAGLVGLAGLATWSLTGRALRPVGAMTRRVRGISSGNLSERIPNPGGNDEIGRLATTMNAMLDRIEQGDKKRRQFVSDAAHELRTPVAVLRSEAEAAIRAPESTSVGAMAETVSSESLRLGQIVEDLLSLARLDERSGQTATPNRAAVDLDELVIAEAKRPRSLPVDQSGVLGGRVHGQTEDLRRVVAHLLDNAARHGATQIAVGVARSSDPDWVELWVDDDGAGVAMPDRKRIFERFIRLDEARTRDAGGSGLGLAVVAAISKSLGGSVEVNDSPLGGARFVVRLPNAADQA